MPREKYVVIYASNPTVETWSWVKALQRRGMNHSWKEWPIVYATDEDSADWGSVLEQATKIRLKAPYCELTVAICPLHGERDSGNFAMLSPGFGAG